MKIKVERKGAINGTEMKRHLQGEERVHWYTKVKGL